LRKREQNARIASHKRTAGRETYGAGRYLDTEMPKNGKVVLDFNKAYNPYCAVNPNSSCPIPPKQNTLLTRVEGSRRPLEEHGLESPYLPGILHVPALNLTVMCYA